MNLKIGALDLGLSFMWCLRIYRNSGIIKRNKNPYFLEQP